MSGKTSTIRDSSRVFIGGVGVVVLAWLWWHGYLFRPVAEPVAVAFSGGTVADGKLGSGEFSDLLAKFLTGALWAIGEIIWIAVTVGWRATKFVGFALVKWLMSFTDAGKATLESWGDTDGDADVLVGDGVAVGWPSGEWVATDVAVASHGERELQERLDTAEATIGKLITAVNRNRDLRKKIEDAKSFAELKRDMEKSK